MKDLAPHLSRQRLIIEGIPSAAVGCQEVKDFLEGLSKEIGMKILVPAQTHRTDFPKHHSGWSGWLHWVESGCFFHAWDSPLFFAADLFSCKKFSAEKAVAFTKKFFRAKEIAFREP